MQQRFEVEMARTIAEHPELQQAILGHWEIERAYDEAHRRERSRGCDRSPPPRRCLG